ncbi:hypothetical protein MXC99_01560 [Thauera aromatica]|uniref:hypothetical protein n=1 Tax=Thauera aromatica TaxID=59405 RepID=UPI001FFD84CB|nr:hypothetical protein [Thauera aromatica]MCK2086879.1 hypothetical protein [Thauera aromatica]
MHPHHQGATAPTIRTSYTPGPWHEHSHRQIGPDEGIVCEVWSAIGWGDTAIEQADANVRLIAAAPELHHACAPAEALLTRQKWKADLHSTEGALLIELRTALAKVEGGAA